METVVRRPPKTMTDVAETFAAAAAGDPIAMRHAAVLTAAGAGRSRHWPAALDWLARAADAGDPAARTQRELMAGLTTAAPRTAPLRASPFMMRAPGFAAPALCDWIIALAATKLEAANVYDLSDELRDENGERSNTGAALGLIEGGLPLLALRERMSALVGIPLDCFETVNVLHYAPGETFSNHYDTFSPEHFATEPDAQRFGHRRFTVLVYLNDDYEGGETDFPLIDWRLHGAKGDALIWRNVTPQGDLDRLTLHAGQPTTRGEKWALSQWIRGKKMPLVT